MSSSVSKAIMWGLAEVCLLSVLLVMPRHSVEVSPQQLVELLWSEYIGDKHSVYHQHILVCNRSDYLFVMVQKINLKNCRRISKKN